MRRVISGKDVKSLQSVAFMTVPHALVKGPAAQPSTPVPDNYPSKLAKYIPGEIIAAYVAILGLLETFPDVPTSSYWVVFAVLLILGAAYVWRATMVKGLPVAVTQIVISTIAFAVWAFALGKPFSLLSWYHPVYASILLILYTLIPPIFLPRE